MKWFFTAVVVALALVQASPDLPPVSRVPVTERLWLVSLVGWSSDPVGEVYAQFIKTCGDRSQLQGASAAAYRACQTKNIKPTRYLVATMHAAPNETSPVVASIYHETILSPDGRFAVTNVDRTSHPGERLAWPDAAEIGDYGLDVSGGHRRGDWVRLLTSIPADGWLRVVPESGPVPRLAIRAHFYRLTELVVELTPLRAVWPQGQSRLTAQGSFMVQKIDGASIEFRSEIPSDFACGDPVTNPVPLPPTLRAPAAEFFNQDGSPRFATKYTKGC